MGVQIKGGKSPPRNRVANEKMVQLIREEQKKRGLIPRNFKCNNCEHTFDVPEKSVTTGRGMCPKCNSVEIEKIAEEL